MKPLGDAVLPLVVAVPAVAAAAIALWPTREAKTLRAVAMAAAILEAVLSLFAFAAFDVTDPNAQGVFDRAWFSLPGAAGTVIPVRLTLGVDGLSILLVALTGLLLPVILLSARGHIATREREFLAWTLLMQAGMQGVFLSLDLVLFYVFWEISIIPLYFVIGIWGGPRRLYATIKFVLYTLAGSFVMLVALLYVIRAGGTADIRELSTRDLPLAPQLLAFGAFALAFAIKVPMFPFHTWLPDAHVEAPTAGSIVLAGVLLKLGTYGFLRLGIGMFPAAAVQLGPWVAGLGAVGVIYGSFLAYGQSDLKKLVACSSVAHMGTVMVGLFALNGAGIRGGLLQMVNHGLSTGLLFLLVGVLYERRHVREIGEFGGLARVVPAFAVLLTFASFASIGLPGLNGFPGEFLCLKGAFDASPLLCAAAAIGTVLGAVYMLSMVRRVLLGPVTRRENLALADVNRREWLAVAILAIPIVWIGVQPGRFIGLTDESVNHLVLRIERGRRQVALAESDGVRVAQEETHDAR